MVNSTFHFITAEPVVCMFLHSILIDAFHHNRNNLIIKNQKRSSSVEDAINYFDLMASYLDVLRNIQEIVRSNISNDVNMNIKDAKYCTYIGIAIVVVVLLVSPIIIFLVKNATNTIQVNSRFSLNTCEWFKLKNFGGPILTRSTHATYPKRQKNWNGRNVKAICCCFRCYRPVWLLS